MGERLTSKGKLKTDVDIRVFGEKDDGEVLSQLLNGAPRELVAIENMKKDLPVLLLDYLYQSPRVTDFSTVVSQRNPVVVREVFSSQGKVIGYAAVISEASMPLADLQENTSPNDFINVYRSDLISILKFGFYQLPERISFFRKPHFRGNPPEFEEFPCNLVLRFRNTDLVAHSEEPNLLAIAFDPSKLVFQLDTGMSIQTDLHAFKPYQKKNILMLGSKFGLIQHTKIAPTNIDFVETKRLLHLWMSVKKIPHEDVNNIFEALEAVKNQ